MFNSFCECCYSTKPSAYTTHRCEHTDNPKHRTSATFFILRNFALRKRALPIVSVKRYEPLFAARGTLAISNHSRQQKIPCRFAQVERLEVLPASETNAFLKESRQRKL